MANRGKLHSRNELERGLNKKNEFPRRPLDAVLEQEIPKEIKLYHIGCLMKSVVEAPEKVRNTIFLSLHTYIKDYLD